MHKHERCVAVCLSHSAIHLPKNIEFSVHWQKLDDALSTFSTDICRENAGTISLTRVTHSMRRAWLSPFPRKQRGIITNDCVNYVWIPVHGLTGRALTTCAAGKSEWNKSEYFIRMLILNVPVCDVRSFVWYFTTQPPYTLNSQSTPNTQRQRLNEPIIHEWMFDNFSKSKIESDLMPLTCGSCLSAVIIDTTHSPHKVRKSQLLFSRKKFNLNWNGRANAKWNWI